MLIGPHNHQAKLAHFWSDTSWPRNSQWHEITGARETVERLWVPTSLQGEHSLAESRHDHWWLLPDVCVGAKNSAGFPNTCWKLDTINRQMHTVLVLLWPLPNVGKQNFGMWGMYNLTKAYSSIKNPLPIAESRTGKSAMVTLKIQPDCSMVLDTILWANIYVRSHLGCGTDFVSSVSRRSHKYFKDAKVMQINRILKIS